MPSYIRGIDVSYWQKDMDFNAIKNSGIAIVYIKSSEGSSYTDKYFEKSYAAAKAAGLDVGVYHYVTAKTVEQAKTQARFFASKVAGKSIDCRLAMDFEDFTGLTNPQIRAIGLAFLEETEATTGKKCIIYSNYSSAQILSAAFARWPLWQAQYGVSVPSPLALWPEWTGWQYSNTGHVNGVNGNVDLNYFRQAIYLSDNSPIPEGLPQHQNPMSSLILSNLVIL